MKQAVWAEPNHGERTMSSTINTQNGTVVARHSSALLYPTLLIAGIAVIIVSMLGIAAVTGLLPQAQSQAVGERAAGGNAGKAAARAKTAGSKTAPAAGGKSAVAAANCTECGVVDSVRALEVKGEGSGLEAVVGVRAGAYAGNEVEKNMKKNASYQIRVRMDDNSYRTFQSAQPDVGVGQRVKVRDGQLVDAG